MKSLIAASFAGILALGAAYADGAMSSNTGMAAPDSAMSNGSMIHSDAMAPKTAHMIKKKPKKMKTDATGSSVGHTDNTMGSSMGHAGDGNAMGTGNMGHGQ